MQIIIFGPMKIHTGVSKKGPMEKKSNTDSADNACETQTNVAGNETLSAAESEAPDTLQLTAGEARFLRRVALQIKSRCENAWTNRATIGRLPMLKELTHIRADIDLVYTVLTDATWRELTDFYEQRKV